MPNLHNILNDPDQRWEIVEAIKGFIDAEIRGKSGMQNMPLKAAYGLLKNFHPGFMEGVLDNMLPQFSQALEPIYQSWYAKPEESRGTFTDALVTNQNQAADALLHVTDQRVAAAQGLGAPVILKTYHELRVTAKKHVVSALPGLGQTLEPFISEATSKQGAAQNS